LTPWALESSRVWTCGGPRFLNGGTIPAERIVTIGDFAERVYLPWIVQHKRPSTAKTYRDIWEDHLKPRCASMWLKDTHAGWLACHPKL